MNPESFESAYIYYFYIKVFQDTFKVFKVFKDGLF